MTRHHHKRPLSDCPLRTVDCGPLTVGCGLRTLDFRLWTSAFVVAQALHAAPVWACAACYGQSDSPMAQGMNWGILSLLFMIGLVLSGVVAFFIYLARKSAAVSVTPPPQPLLSAARTT